MTTCTSSNAGNVTSFEGQAYAYNDVAHKHALTHSGGVQKHWYDANGNATKRITDATYDLTYDADNRLTQLQKNSAVSGTSVYDGDGQRVKETAGSVNTVYIGDYFEWTGSPATMKSYYYAGGTRVAERSGTTLYYLLGDHLGSQALTLTSAGGRLNTNTELRYYPYGVTRYIAGTTPTTFNFTGQRKDSGSGLLFYNARWYDPVVGRFLQADTIVPAPGDPQSLNRYSYVGNRPLNFTDPTGHMQACEDGDEGGGCGYGGLHNKIRWIKTGSGVYIDLAHFAEAQDTAEQILEGIDSGSSFPIARVSTAKMGPVNLRAGIRATYKVQADLTSDQRAGTALGILMDSSYLFENFQDLPPSSHSSFSGEDLSSDYLGFYAAMIGKSLGELLTVLGPPKAATANIPKNHQFTPLVQDSAGQWRNSPWPASLSITPINSDSGIWHRVATEPVGNAWSGAGGLPRLFGPSNILGQIHGWTLVP